MVRLQKIKVILFVSTLLVSSFSGAQLTADMATDRMSDASVSINTFDSVGALEDFAKDRQPYLDSSENFVSFGTDMTTQADSVGRALSNFSNLRLVAVGEAQKAVQATRSHAREQAAFYNFKTNKTAVIMLTVLTANSAANWIWFGGTTPDQAKLAIVMMNAFLYAYVGVNVPNWRALLSKSDQFLQRSLNKLKVKNIREETSKFMSSSLTNFGYYAVYNYAVQGILNFNDLNAVLGADVLALVLANSAFGVYSSGFWDPVFDRWIKSGRVSEANMQYLYHTRSITMGVLSNLAAIGISQSYWVMALSGGVATSILVSKAVSSLDAVNRIKRRMNAGSLSFRRTPVGTARSCRGFL